MRKGLQIISWLALAATVVPSIMFLSNSMGLDQVKLIMLIATIVWLVVTPMWMGRETA